MSTTAIEREEWLILLGMSADIRESSSASTDTRATTTTRRTTTMRSEDYRRWRHESHERLRRAYELVERGLAELDAKQGRSPRPWREAAAEHLDRVRAELRRAQAS